MLSFIYKTTLRSSRTVSLLGLSHFRQFGSASTRQFRFPRLLGSSALVGTYLCFLLLTDREDVPNFYPDDFPAILIRRLPFNALSKLFGWIAEIHIPESMRPMCHSAYANFFNCNLYELADPDLKNYRTINEFFGRKLIADCRPVDSNASLVSPADGEIMHVGPLTSPKFHLEQVKGVKYSMKQFLGPVGKRPSLSKKSSSTASDSERRFYQCVIYLAPGDYHRFHNPTDWKASVRRHFPGRLLSVRPQLVTKLPGLFALNERVVYLGEWKHGLMTLTAVGALGVGNIHIPMDSNLETNRSKDNQVRFRSVHCPDIILPYHEQPLREAVSLEKGSEFGQFRFGSTIVLVFEAPQDGVAMCVKRGDRVKMGQALLHVK